MRYADACKVGMELLAKDERVLFVGQAMLYKGHSVSRQVVDIPVEQRIEMPVAENFQMGYCLGLALQGFIPVSVYPRFNFAILACDQIFNHLDKWEAMSDGQSKPKCIIKVVVGANKPLDPGHQHQADYSDAFESMATNIDIHRMKTVEDVLAYHQLALLNPKSCILVEYGNLYAEL